MAGVIEDSNLTQADPTETSFSNLYEYGLHRSGSLDPDFAEGDLYTNIQLTALASEYAAYSALKSAVSASIAGTSGSFVPAATNNNLFYLPRYPENIRATGVLSGSSGKKNLIVFSDNGFSTKEPGWYKTGGESSVTFPGSVTGSFTGSTVQLSYAFMGCQNGVLDTDLFEVYVNLDAAIPSYSASAVSDTIVSGTLLIPRTAVTGGIEIRYTGTATQQSSWNYGLYCQISIP